MTVAKTLLGSSMTRRAALGGMTLGAGAAAAGRSPHRAAAHQGGSVSSGGIGLDLEAWEEMHGEGEAGQSLASYEDGAYYVGLAAGVVVFIELGWEDVGGIPYADAVAAVEDLLPSDAGLEEIFDLPPTPAGPAGLFVRRYYSPTLEGLLASTPQTLTGAIGAVFQEDEGLLDPPVRRVSIAVARVR